MLSYRNGLLKNIKEHVAVGFFSLHKSSNSQGRANVFNSNFANTDSIDMFLGALESCELVLSYSA